MPRLLLFVFFALLGNWCAAQKSFNPDFTSLNLSCPHNDSTAKEDIRDRKPKFFCYGSIIPVAMTRLDKEVEKKYGFVYIQVGCTPFGFECMSAYNRIIAKELDKKFGPSWRENARKDIYGVTK